MAPGSMVLDVQALREVLQDYGDATLNTKQGQAVERAIAVLESYAVELAPVDTGNLEGATSTRVTKRGSVVSGLLAFATPYAAKAHEMPESSRGPKTQAKPGNEFGPAGPKYLERALRGMAKKLPSIIAEVMS